MRLCSGFKSRPPCECMEDAVILLYPGVLIIESLGVWFIPTRSTRPTELFACAIALTPRLEAAISYHRRADEWHPGARRFWRRVRQQAENWSGRWGALTTRYPRQCRAKHVLGCGCNSYVERNVASSRNTVGGNHAGDTVMRMQLGDLSHWR